MATVIHTSRATDLVTDLRNVVESRGNGYTSYEVVTLLNRAANEIEDMQRVDIDRYTLPCDPMDIWQPISSAPKDGTPVDLWLVGPDDNVDFYSPAYTR